MHCNRGVDRSFQRIDATVDGKRYIVELTLQKSEVTTIHQTGKRPDIYV